MNNFSSCEYDDSLFGYGVSFVKTTTNTPSDGELKKGNEIMGSGDIYSRDGMADSPIAYTDFTFDKYSKIEQKFRNYHKFVAQTSMAQKKPKYFSYYAPKVPNNAPPKTSPQGSAVVSNVLPASFKMFIVPCIRGIDIILELLAKIRFPYLILMLSIILGYVLGIHYWNTSSNSFLYPTKRQVLEKINDNHTSAGHVVSPNMRKLKNVDMTQFTAVEKKEYTLQNGDTLLAIALAHKVSIDTLISWNKISDALRIRQGKKLIIPNKDGLIHVVKNGESIASIAQRYNINENKILDMNDLQSLILRPGMDLFIPGVKLDSFDRGLVLGTVFQTPLRGRPRFTSAYGYRISPITGKRSFHNGIDITSRYGTIHAASGGVVIYVSARNPVFGKIVIVRHARGFQTLYGHMSTISVKKRQRVGRGDVLGKVGNSGLSTGPHLHFSIIKNGASVNPRKYIRL